MKPKYAIAVMFIVMLFALGLVAQTASPVAGSDAKACACCNHAAAADLKDCCKDGKREMKDGKMACAKDCCKSMADNKSCCKDGKCEMAKGDKGCCGASCKMSKTS